MMCAKPVHTTLGQHFRLTVEQPPQNEAETADMEKVPYASGIESIMYGMAYSHPDLAFNVSVVSRFMSNPGRTHWEAMEWVLKYIKGSVDTGMLYCQEEGETDMLVGYVDSDFAGNIYTRKSVIDYVFTFFETAVSWKSNL